MKIHSSDIIPNTRLPEILIAKGCTNVVLALSKASNYCEEKQESHFKREPDLPRGLIVRWLFPDKG